ncbi:MAG: NAD-dependent epimerase/dehydratase family protein [Actinomycetota bacterium]|nr:MAG: UDP-glucose [Actinomycetota bacterium]MDO8950962.1 NAD-dependent epimerase/dehydratase family protein [Actinomycetota bacterium]MDP3630549.1 NAD-dependent epimerase/dehydratase family protein [Actinomycetota bacterium]
MKALVTGGAGFIGSNLVALLLNEGHEVVVLDDLSSGYSENLEPGVEFVRCDVADCESVRAAAVGVDIVFHLAASVGNARAIEHPLRDSEVNVLGTLSVLEAARSEGIQRVVLSSSAGIFGELKTLPIAEDHPQDPDSPYGVSKLAAEKMCLVYNKLHGMDNVCLRYFNVYGRNQRFDAYGNVIPIFAERMLRGQEVVVFGDGLQTRDFVNVRDVVRANYLAGTSDAARGAFNLGSATRVTINDLASMMGELAGVEPVFRHTAPRSGDVRDSLAAIGAATEAFGFVPSVPLEHGLREYMSWLREDEVTLARWRDAE